jgi:hypothetical protein
MPCGVESCPGLRGPLEKGPVGWSFLDPSWLRDVSEKSCFLPGYCVDWREVGTFTAILRGATTCHLMLSAASLVCLTCYLPSSWRYNRVAQPLKKIILPS